MEQKEDFLQKKKELAALRMQWQKVHNEKEQIFSQLKGIRDKLRVVRTAVEPLKQQRDQFAEQVKKLKPERDQLNLTAKEKAGEKKKVDEQRQEKLPAHPVDIRKLKIQMDFLERKIETEVVPFSKEQEIRKHIKQLQAQYKQAQQQREIWKEARHLAADFSSARRSAQEVHQKIQDVAQLSQQKHQEMNSFFEQLRELRKQEKPLMAKHSELRSLNDAIQKQLEELQQQVQQLAKILQEEDVGDFRSKIEAKKAAVQEKLKSGKKLNMDDILAFQAGKE